MSAYSQPLDLSADLATASQAFLAEVRDWIHACIERYADAPATDVHDQGTFTTGWEPYIRATGDAEALTFMKDLRDRIHNHFVESGQWRHGYWTLHEAHHGTEHFELFLGALLRLDPNDAETKRQILDAAEHVGNWVADVPDWFNWETVRFHSLFIGTDGVKHEPGSEINTPDHLRFVNICLLAYDASEDERYLDFATRYAGEWAAAILAEETIPIALTVEGPLYEFAGDNESTYRSFVGEVAGLHSPVERAENLLSSDAVNAFLRLWKETGRAHFRAAVEKLLDVLITQLGDPDAGVVADAVRSYRHWTGDDRYDGAVIAVVQQGAPRIVRTITLDTDFRHDHKPSGVGKRSDMPRWLENSSPRWHNPITMAVAAEIQHDEHRAARALDLARVTFALALEAFPDGRDHGCAARTVSAVARGHGRDNHAGMTTAVLGPLLNEFQPHLVSAD